MSIYSADTKTADVAARTFDAIVIGSGISGGWAAKELCEQGYLNIYYVLEGLQGLSRKE